MNKSLNFKQFNDNMWLTHNQPSSQKMDTRTTILNSAIELFSQKGFEAVSVRDVTKQANVNLASVSYHFGNKEGLIQEAVSVILNPLNEERLENLKKAGDQANGVQNLTLEEIFKCFLTPLLAPSTEGSNPALFTKLIAKFITDPTLKLPESTYSLYKECLVNYVKAIYVKRPDMSPEDIREHLVFISGAAINYGILGPMAASLTNETDAVSQNKLMNDIINFCVYGVQGPPKEALV